MRFRKTNPEDLPQLKELWKRGFDDTDEAIDAFFAVAYPNAAGFCAEEDGRIAAALYALPQTVACEDETCRAAYLYAVTTHPDFRRRGICRDLIAYTEKSLRKRYFDCLLLVPASEQLRAYYASLGFIPQKAAFEETGPAPEARGLYEALSPQEYAGLRETILLDTPHVRYSLDDLRYEATMAAFYRLEIGTHFGCAAAHREGDTLVADEILPDGALLPALLKAVPAKTCRVRAPGAQDAFAMCKWLTEPKWNEIYLAFDFA